jgi:hypothetical protein
MKKKTSLMDVVKYIYVYFFSAVGTIMILVGIYQFAEYIFNSTVAPEYRLEQYREDQCNYIDQSAMTAYPVDAQPKVAEKTKEERAEDKKICLENLEKERAYQQKRDIFDATMLTTLGLLVFGIHFVWMRSKFLSHE